MIDILSVAQVCFYKSYYFCLDIFANFMFDEESVIYTSVTYITVSLASIANINTGVFL